MNTRALFFTMMLSLILWLNCGEASASIVSSYDMPEASECISVSDVAAFNWIAVDMKLNFEKKNYRDVIMIAQSVLDQYADKARSMQNSLPEFPWESGERIRHFGALNLVSLALYWQARSYLALGDIEQARAQAKQLITEFYYGQCENDKSAFIKPAHAVLLNHQEFTDLGPVPW